MARQKRKRGGQPGNSNATTHGFYSKYIDDELKQELSHLPPLDAGIAALRLKIKAILKYDSNNLKVLIRATNTLARRLNLRSQRQDLCMDKEKLRNAMEEIILGMLIPGYIDAGNAGEKT